MKAVLCFAQFACLFILCMSGPLSVAQGLPQAPGIVTKPLQIAGTPQSVPSIPPGLALQFAPGVSYATGGTAPYGVAVGDLNGDGKLDLVVANQDQDTVAVMLGRGDGTFSSPVLYGLTPGIPTQVVLADFNGDGKLDVAAITGDIDGYSSYVVVLLGNGDGTLGAPSHYDSGTSGVTIIAADLNNDRKPDVVVGGNGNLSVLYGNGDGTFGTPVPLTSQAGALFSAAVGDFNHDGRVDVVGVVFYPHAGITVFLQNPDGSFSEGQTFMSPIPIGVGAGVGDFNQDGNLDVLISGNRAGAASFLGNGDGTFQSPILFNAGSEPGFFALEDFNRDGTVDAAFADYSTLSNTEGVDVKAGSNQGFFGFNEVPLSTPGGTQVVAAGDFNGDGWPDIVSANTNGNNITIYLNTIGVNLGPQQFVSISPCRLVDTRGNGGPIPGGTIATFPLPQQGSCGSNIPSSAAAYSLNITVVPHGPLGYLTVWPAGGGQPTVSTMNSPDGRIKANAAIVPGGNQGGVMVYVTDTADLLIDIDGYFTPPATNTYQFYPLSPCRIVDTRGGQDGGTLQAGVERDYAIPPNCGVPADAVAYSFNVTAVPGGGGLDYLTVWPKGRPRPTVSTLNDDTGTIVANAAIVPAADEGATAFYPNNHNTDLLVDVDGYFAAPGINGLSMYPVVPCRVLDTRQDGGSPFVGEKIVDVVGSPCAPPSAARAYIFNATVVPPGSMPYLTLWPDLEQQPIVSTLNAYDSFITSNMAIVPTTNGSIDAYAAGLTQLILDISGYFAP